MFSDLSTFRGRYTNSLKIACTVSWVQFTPHFTLLTPHSINYSLFSIRYSLFSSSASNAIKARPHSTNYILGFSENRDTNQFASVNFFVGEAESRSNTVCIARLDNEAYGKIDSKMIVKEVFRGSQIV